jgi:hypothetical protein
MSGMKTFIPNLRPMVTPQPEQPVDALPFEEWCKFAGKEAAKASTNKQEEKQP